MQAGGMADSLFGIGLITMIQHPLQHQQATQGDSGGSVRGPVSTPRGLEEEVGFFSLSFAGNSEPLEEAEQHGQHDDASPDGTKDRVEGVLFSLSTTHTRAFSPESRV